MIKVTNTVVFFFYKILRNNSNERRIRTIETIAVVNQQCLCTHCMNPHNHMRRYVLLLHLFYQYSSLRLREVEQPIQNHTAGRGQNGTMKPRLYDLNALAVIHYTSWRNSFNFPVFPSLPFTLVKAFNPSEPQFPYL